MTRLMVLAVFVAAQHASMADGPPTVFEKAGEPPVAGQIDRLVFAKLAADGLRPARLCSDAVFVRRAYLDVLGVLPTADEVRTFLQAKAPDKRAKLIDRLLERDEFADYWAMRWGDLLRVKSEFPINLWPNAVQAYHRYLRTSIRDNVPYDRFVRELLTASGSNFRTPAVNFYRAVQSHEPSALAKTVALTFMGDRMGSWPEDRRTGMVAFFRRVGYKSTAEWKEQIVFFDLAADGPGSAMLPDGTTVALPADRDPRAAFADWLIADDNPWFARCAVNRVWWWLLGRGIVHEPDDFRPDNPPSHPELLAMLADELVAAKYDLKHVYRLILTSSTYQLSSVPRSAGARAAECFAYYPVRRLDAEVLVDALCRLTGTTEAYSSQIPEPFTWVPRERSTVALPDGSITSSFLEMFGRPPRDTGMAAERTHAVTAAQALHLLNSSHVRDKIERGPELAALRRAAARDPRKAAAELYLRILSRYPTAGEIEAIETYVAAGRGTRGANPVADVVWALVNSAEFLYRH